MSTGGGDHRRLMSEINVTPLVDVMLVLLIIFMVTAPLLQEKFGSVDINVPKVTTDVRNPYESEPIELQINGKGEMSVGTKDTHEGVKDLEALKSKLGEIFSVRDDKTLLFWADKTLDYGLVMEAIATAKAAGATKLAMIVKPLGEEK